MPKLYGNSPNQQFRPPPNPPPKNKIVFTKKIQLLSTVVRLGCFLTTGVGHCQLSLSLFSFHAEKSLYLIFSKLRLLNCEFEQSNHLKMHTPIHTYMSPFIPNAISRPFSELGILTPSLIYIWTRSTGTIYA